MLIELETALDQIKWALCLYGNMPLPALRKCVAGIAESPIKDYSQFSRADCLVALLCGIEGDDGQAAIPWDNFEAKVSEQE